MTFVLSKPQEQWQEMVALNRNSNSSNGSRNGFSNNNNNDDGFRSHTVGPSLALYDSKLLLRRRKKAPIWLARKVAIAIVLLSVVVVPYYFSRPDKSTTLASAAADETTTTTTASMGISSPKANADSHPNQTPGRLYDVPLQEGRFGSYHIAYYHQPAGIPQTPPRHLVLLHGSAFTKEDWKKFGILQLFAEKHPRLAITALDLEVSADYHKLTKVLSELVEAKIVESLPVSGLVTPSASGKSVTSYIKDADTTTATSLGSYIRSWIPVASYSVGSCTDYELRAFGLSSIDVLAIYGDRDKKGRRVSQQLVDQAGAVAVELPGPHPVYKESPEAFVETVANKVLENNNHL